MAADDELFTTVPGTSPPTAPTVNSQVGGEQAPSTPKPEQVPTASKLTDQVADATKLIAEAKQANIPDAAILAELKNRYSDDIITLAIDKYQLQQSQATQASESVKPGDMSENSKLTFDDISKFQTKLDQTKNQKYGELDRARQVIAPSEQPNNIALRQLGSGLIALGTMAGVGHVSKAGEHRTGKGHQTWRAPILTGLASGAATFVGDLGMQMAQGSGSNLNFGEAVSNGIVAAVGGGIYGHGRNLIAKQHRVIKGIQDVQNKIPLVSLSGNTLRVPNDPVKTAQNVERTLNPFTQLGIPIDTNNLGASRRALQDRISELETTHKWGNPLRWTGMGAPKREALLNGPNGIRAALRYIDQLQPVTPMATP